MSLQLKLVAIYAMFIRGFIVCLLRLVAEKSSMWKENTTGQLMSLHSMRGRRRSLRFGREFVLLWWFMLFKKMVFSLYCVELFLFGFVVLSFLFGNENSVVCFQKKVLWHLTSSTSSKPLYKRIRKMERTPELHRAFQQREWKKERI